MQVALNIPAKFEGLLRPARYKIYKGGRGSGKTENFAQVIIARVMREKLLVLCTRMYQNSIDDSVYRVLVAWIYELKVERYFDIQAKKIICLITNSQIIFKGLQRNIAEIKSTKGVNIIWVEEADSVTMDTWLFLDPTIRENNSEVWISFNPNKEDDATNVRFVTKPQPDSIIVHVNWYDNPFFPPVLEKLRQNMLANDLDNYGWVWEGECRKITEAAVYNKKLTIKTFDDPPSDTRFYHGLDFGFSVDPTVLIRCWTAPSTEGFGEDIYIDREAYGHQIELDEMPAFFDATVETARNWHIKADNARPECISYLSRQGYGISAAEKWAGSVEDGIAHIRAFRNIIIHETRCPNTVRDFRLYSYKVDKRTVDENGKPQVLPILEEKNDHAPDAGRYALDGLIQQRGGIGVWQRLMS